jgi:site-specific DNA-methyltransferase (adenine-specific)
MQIIPKRVYVGDGLKVMNLMPDNYVDLTVTSCPYDQIRDYHGFVFDYKPMARELYRITKPGGVVCWNVQAQTIDGSETLTPQKHSIFFVEECGFKLHETIIYQKLNFSHPARNRYPKVWEYVFVFSKGAPKTFNPIKDRKNKTAGKLGSLGVNTFTKKDGSKGVRKRKINTPFGVRHNVWIGKTRGQEEMFKKLKQPAMMPMWLAQDLIKSYSNEGEIVFDPMAGSGTTAKMSEAHNRQWIISEISIQYAKDSLSEIPAHKSALIRLKK